MVSVTPGGEASHDITQLYIHQEDVEEFLIHSFRKFTHYCDKVNILNLCLYLTIIIVVQIFILSKYP